MVKKYVTGLVVGKFCPLHKGHISVIRKALEMCENVVIISYTSEKYPGCKPKNRQAWLERAVEDCTDDLYRVKIHVLDDMVEQLGLKDNADEDLHRKFCADYLLNTVETTVQAVFTSEDYGQGFADYLTLYFTVNLQAPVIVNHIMVDKERTRWSISGTQLRESSARSDVYLPSYVRQSFVRRVLFLGAESTGKTTLVKAMGDDDHRALEFGRYLYDKRRKNLLYEDMAYIGKSQIVVEKIKAQNLKVTDYLYCDTSPLTTKFYSQEMFGRVSRELSDLVRDTEDSYYKIFLCAPDFPLVQDGTRQNEKFRQRGHEFYLKELEDQNYTLLTGSLEERIAKVKEEL